MITIKIENCGRFFDDYVLYDGKEMISIEQWAKNLPRELLKKSKLSPESAKAVLDIYDEINPDEAKKILKTGRLTRKDFKRIISLI